jgi:hypothetical protein
MKSWKFNDTVPILATPRPPQRAKREHLVYRLVLPIPQRIIHLHDRMDLLCPPRRSLAPSHSGNSPPDSRSNIRTPRRSVPRRSSPPTPHRSDTSRVVHFPWFFSQPTFHTNLQILRHLRNHLLHQLVPPDRLPKRLPLMIILHRYLQTRPNRPVRPSRYREPPVVQRHMAILNPSPSSPNRFSSGTHTSSNNTVSYRRWEYNNPTNPFLSVGFLQEENYIFNSPIRTSSTTV